MDLNNVPWEASFGLPALFGFIGLVSCAYFFRRPYIAVAGGILGLLFGIGVN